LALEQTGPYNAQRVLNIYVDITYEKSISKKNLSIFGNTFGA
jgi:hypothetical protein